MTCGPLRKYPFGARTYFQRPSEFAALVAESRDLARPIYWGIGAPVN